jgi:hypothetical protein
MAIGDGVLSIQFRSSRLLVFQFPTVKAGTRDVELMAAFGHTEMICQFKNDEFEP